MNLETIAKIADLDRFGSFDFAVPIDWMMRDPEKHRPHVWYYPHGNKRHSLYGRPLAWKAMARLALRNMRKDGIPNLDKWLDLWAYCHPGKTIDADGIAAAKRFIENSSESMRHHMACIISRHQIPPPPPGTFDLPMSQAA